MQTEKEPRRKKKKRKTLAASASVELMGVSLLLFGLGGEGKESSVIISAYMEMEPI